MRNRIHAQWRVSRQVAIEIVANQAWRRIAFFLLPVAGVLAGLDVAAHYGELTDAPLPAQFFLSKDGSFGEYLEYALTAATAIMFLILWLRKRAAIHLVNAVLFVYLTADNAFEFHERFGQWIAPWMPHGTPLPPNDIGEMLLFASIGAAWLGALVLALRAAELRESAYALILAAGIAGAGFFGVVADAVTSWGSKSDFWIVLEAWIEDGGEFAMILLTFLAACAIFDIERRRAAEVRGAGLTVQ